MSNLLAAFRVFRKFLKLEFFQSIDEEVLRLSIALCESPSQPSHLSDLSIRLPALIMQMTLVTKNVKVKNVLKSKRTTVQIAAPAERRLFSIDLLYCFWCPDESRSVEHYNSVSNLTVFFFFLEFKRKETNPEIKKNNQSRYNRFRPLVLRGHVTNASFKQWAGILVMPKIDRALENYLTLEIWEETHLRRFFMAL